MLSPTDWHNYFRGNKDNPRTINWTSASTDSDRQRAALSRSLSHFQLGESGEGKRIRRLAATRGEDYSQAVELFVKEENGHARLLAEAIEYLDGKLTFSHWTETVFVALRRLLSLRVEVQVLAIAEIIGLDFYGMVKERTKDESISLMCDIFLQEETKHLEFDADSIVYLAGRQPGILFRTCSRVLFLGAICAAWLDHGPTLRLYGYSFAEWMRRTSITYKDFCRRRDGV